MPLDPYLAKALLDWTTGAAAVTQPASRFIQFATGTPGTASDLNGGFVSRVTVSMMPANSPAGTASNGVAITGATATVSATVVAFNVYDRSSGGTRLYWGTVTAALGCKSATDNPAFAVGNLTLVIS